MSQNSNNNNFFKHKYLSFFIGLFYDRYYRHGTFSSRHHVLSRICLETSLFLPYIPSLYKGNMIVFLSYYQGLQFELCFHHIANVLEIVYITLAILIILNLNPNGENLLLPTCYHNCIILVDFDSMIVIPWYTTAHFAALWTWTTRAIVVFNCYVFDWLFAFLLFLCNLLALQNNFRSISKKNQKKQTELSLRSTWTDHMRD